MTVFHKMLSGKLHHVRVTHTDTEYVGSIGIPEALLRASGIRPMEEVHVWNVESKDRFTTYAVPSEPGTVKVLGGAARYARTGDRLVIASFAYVPAGDDAKVANWRSRLVMVGGDNTVERLIDAAADDYRPWNP